MNKYYYVSYACLIQGSWVYGGVLVREFPLEWVKNCNEKYKGERYVILSWQEVTDEEFNKYNVIYPI